MVNYGANKVRFMFQDEGRFGRINNPTRCWCRKGVRPSVPYQIVREYTYAYAAVCPDDGEMVSLILPYSNSECMSIFLEEVSKRFLDEYIILVADNAAWHKSKTLRIPENIEIFPLLPYSPELNPVEHIWDEIREKGFKNEIFSSMKLVENRLCSLLLELELDTEKVKSITGWDWLVDKY